MKQKMIMLVVLVTIGIIAAVGVNAFSGHGMMVKDPALEDALESGDYDSFVAALESSERGSRMADMMTEDRFVRMVERHQSHEDVEQALENKDYDTFMSAIESHPRASELSEKITSENFETFVAMHEAREDGDHDTAKALAEELGLEPRGALGKHGRKGGCGGGKR